MAKVELRDIVKRYGQNVAVNHVNLTVEDGEFLILLGPSGCGKTTSLRSIAGLEALDGGEILIDDVVVNDKRASDRDTAFCFQQYALYPHLTAFENIAFPLRTQQMANQEVEHRVTEVGKQLQIEEIFTRKPSKLSAGDQQRVALARAMVRQPKVYLMDEPLSNLDAQLRVDMRGELRRLQITNRITTIYVTHDQTEAMAMADRIAIMNLGVLQQVGTPDDVYTYPVNLFVANFIGSPSMNFINCEYVAADHGVRIPTETDSVVYRLPEDIKQSVSGLKDGDELVLGIRPEDVYIHTEPVDDGFEVKYILLEALGSENIHHVGHSNLFVIARTSPADVFEEGQSLWISFEHAGIRLFDRKTEMAI